MFGMKAYLINMHLLVPRSKSSAKVKVKYKGYISQKMAVSGAFMFHKHILSYRLQMLSNWSCPNLCHLVYPFPNNIISTRPNLKSLQITILNLMKMAEIYPHR